MHTSCSCKVKPRNSVIDSIVYCPLHAAALGMRDVLQKVVTHFDGTDSPLGQEASVLLREIGGKEVE